MSLQGQEPTMLVDISARLAARRGAGVGVRATRQADVRVH